MLEYVKELKEKIEKMNSVDCIILDKKKSLKQKVKQGDITNNQKKILKNEIIDLVYDKIEIYLQVCKIARRYKVFGLDKILDCTLNKYTETEWGTESEDYSFFSIEKIKKDMNKDIIYGFVKNHNSLTKVIADDTQVVKIVDLLQKCTDEKWAEITIQSPYTYTTYHDYEKWEEPSFYSLCVNEKYLDLFKDKQIDKNLLEKYILEKKCVLLENIWCDVNGKDNYNYIDDKLVFSLSLDTSSLNVYEKLYPNLKNVFWDLFNEKTLDNIKNAIKENERKIKDNEQNIKNLQQEIETSKHLIKTYHDELNK